MRLPGETFKLKDGREVALRTFEPADAAALVPFFEQIASETNHTLQYVGRKHVPAELAEHVREAAESPAALELGAFDGAEVVGLLGFTPFAHPWLSHAGSFRMMIVERFQGGGLGRRMLAILDAHARAAGIARIEGLVRTSNEHGIALYKTSGYEIEGTRRRGSRIDGVFADEYSIAKLL